GTRKCSQWCWRCTSAACSRGANGLLRWALKSPAFPSVGLTRTGWRRWRASSPAKALRPARNWRRWRRLGWRRLRRRRMASRSSSAPAAARRDSQAFRRLNSELDICANSEQRFVADLRVTPGMDDVLEVRSHITPRRRLETVKRLDRIFCLRNLDPRSRKQNRIGGATVVLGAPDRQPDRVVGPLRRCADIGQPGVDLIVERRGRMIGLHEIEEHVEAVVVLPAGVPIIGCAAGDLLLTLHIKAKPIGPMQRL